MKPYKKQHNKPVAEIDAVRSVNKTLVKALIAVRSRMESMAIFSTDQETGETFDHIVDEALALAKTV